MHRWMSDGEMATEGVRMRTRALGIGRLACVWEYHREAWLPVAWQIDICVLRWDRSGLIIATAGLHSAAGGLRRCDARKKHLLESRLELGDELPERVLPNA